MSRAQYTGIGSYKCYYLLLILAYSSVFFTFASLAAYVCLGIYFLSQDYYIRDICFQSVLWEYVLLSIIFAGNKLSVYYLKKFTKKDYKFIKGVNLGSLIIEGILILLGGFGVFDYELACGNDNSNLWKFGIASFLLQIVYFFIAICRGIDYCLIEPPGVKSIVPNIPIKMDELEMNNDVFIEENTDDVIGPEFARLEFVSEI
jgi:hypothetical protein